MVNNPSSAISFYDLLVKNNWDHITDYGCMVFPIYARTPYAFSDHYLQTNINIGANKTLLDLCCGTGIHAIKQAKAGYIVTGIDGSQISISKAQELAEKFKVQKKTYFSPQNIGGTLQLPSQAFDVVFISGGLYYLDIQKILPEILRVLKPGGELICIETNGSNSIMNIIRRIKAHFLKHRDQQTLNNLLTLKDIKTVRSCFNSSEVHYFDCFTLLGRFLTWNHWLATKWHKFANLIDYVILNKLKLRRLAFKFVLIAKK